MGIKTISPFMFRFIEKVLPKESLKEAEIIGDHLEVTLNDGWEFDHIGNKMRVFFVREAKNILLTAHRVSQHTEEV